MFRGRRRRRRAYWWWYSTDGWVLLLLVAAAALLLGSSPSPFYCAYSGCRAAAAFSLVRVMYTLASRDVCAGEEGRERRRRM